MKKYILKGCGGSGVTYFESKYSKNLIPTTRYGKHDKNYGDGVTPIIYLYANPIDVVLSFDRRGFLYPAIEQLNGLVEKRNSILDTGDEGIHAWDLQEYLKHGDLLQLEEHYEFFTKAPQKVFIIKYHVLSNEKRIREMLGIKSSVHWSHINPRITNKEDYSMSDLMALSQIYKDWTLRFNILPDIQIINNEQ